MKISVALCTYNGAKYIKEQIDSILNQTKKVDEIIVCDDCSSDKTIEILNAYAAKNPGLFKIYINEKNLRSVKNFEKSISLTLGEYIFLADQDDIWVENKVEEMLGYFKMNPTCLALFSDGFLLSEKQLIINKTNLWSSVFFNPKQFLNPSHLYLFLILKRNAVTGATLCIKKETKQLIFPFPILKDFHHDYWIAYLLAQTNQLNFINKKLIKYRLHQNQQVGTTIKNSYFKILKNKWIDKFLFKNEKVPFLLRKKTTKLLMNNLCLFQSLLIEVENETLKTKIVPR